MSSRLKFLESLRRAAFPTWEAPPVRVAPERFAAIPTLYKGVQMRSRLEAKWAAFFDLCGWKWEYEPFDLEGWIPDFLLTGKRGRILVEVKPATEFPTEAKLKISKATDGTAWDGRDDAGTADHEVLLLGLGPFESRGYFGSTAIGWIGCGEAGMVRFSEGLDFFDTTCSYHYRLSGGGNGGYPEFASAGEVMALWAEASNAVQWKKPAPSHSR